MVQKQQGVARDQTPSLWHSLGVSAENHLEYDQLNLLVAVSPPALSE